MPSKPILITGAAGRVARVIRPALAQHYTLRLFDIAPIPDARDAFIGDILDDALLDRAMDGVGAVIHLAAQPKGDDFESVILPRNIVGAYRVYEAARRHKVRRVVLASTNHTVEGHSPLIHLKHAMPHWAEDEQYPVTLPLAAAAPVKPDGLYGISKVFGESLARYYADFHGVTSVCLRLGSVAQIEDGRPAPPHFGAPRAWGLWMSDRDLCEIFRCAVEAEGIGCAIVYGISRNTRRWWDLSNQQLIGFTPQDDSEAMLADWFDGVVPPAPTYPLPWGERLAALPASHDWLVWIGQSGFFVKTRGGLKIAIDPFLTVWHDRPQAPLMHADDLPADLVLITQTHRDHLDVHALPIIARMRPHARFITPRTGRDRLLTLGIGDDRIVVLRPHQQYTQDDASITAIPARHQETAPDAQGYVLHLPDVTLYHTGDSEYDPCLMTARAHKPDILLAPINGRGGNMTPEQAAQLAADLAVSHVTPMHYGCLQKPNEEPAGALLHRFCSICSVPTAVMELGAIVRLPLKNR